MQVEAGHRTGGLQNSAEGRQVCLETARGVGRANLGDVVYFLLAFNWNDALEWADKNG